MAIPHEKPDSLPPDSPPTFGADVSTMVTKDVGDDHVYLDGFGLLATMISITLVGFLMLLDTSIISTAIPKITTDFHSLEDVGWYGTAYLISNCALQPLTGKLYTYFNNKWLFLGFFTLFEIGSAICGAAPSSTVLIIGRAIAGMGSSGLLNGGYTIIYASVAPSKQPSLLGILLGFCQLGLLGGPLIGGALTQHVSWRWCFYINLPCGAVVGALLLFITLPDYTGKKRLARNTYFAKLDLIGFVIFAGASIQLLLALNWGGSVHAWTSSTIIGLFVGSGAALFAFVAWEWHKGEDAMIPLSIVRRRIVWSSCVNYSCFAGTLLVSTYYLPIYFQAVKHASPTMSGVDLLPTIIGNALFAIFTGAAVQRYGYYLPFGVASGLFNTIGSGLLTTLTPTSPSRAWIGYQVLQGIGGGLGLQIPLVAVQNNASKDELSVLTAMVVFAQQFGGAVFLALAQVIFSTSLRSDLTRSASNDDAAAIIAAGATGIRDVATGQVLQRALSSYAKSFDKVMYLATGAAGGSLLFAFGMGWVNIKSEKLSSGTKEQNSVG